VIDSGFIFQNPHRRVAVPDVPMLEKGPMFPMFDFRCSHRTNTNRIWFITRSFDCSVAHPCIYHSKLTCHQSTQFTSVYAIKQTCPSQAALLLCWLWFVCQSWCHKRQTEKGVNLVKIIALD